MISIPVSVRLCLVEETWTEERGGESETGMGTGWTKKGQGETHVVPERHDEHHVAGEGLGHLGQAALVLEAVGVAEGDLLAAAEGLVDLVAAVTGDGGLGVGDDLAALDVEAADGLEVAAGADELRHDGELAVRVDRLARPVEVRGALPVRVEVAPIRVAHARVPVRRVRPAAVVLLAHRLPYRRARVRCVRRRDAVGLCTARCP